MRGAVVDGRLGLEQFINALTEACLSGRD